MASPQGSTHYHLLPARPSEDTEGDESPTASLLPKLLSARRVKTHTLTLNPTLLLRLLANIVATTGFTILVVDAVHLNHGWYRRGLGDYVAAAVFLGLLMVHNTIMIIHQLVARTFKITIQFKHQGWSSISEGRKRPMLGRVAFDLGIAFCLALSLIIGNGVGRYHFNPGRIAGVVFAYIAV